MKKLKFLLIPLISLLFVINVNATEHYTNGVVSNLDRYLSTGKSLSDFQDLIKNNVDFTSLITKENYIVEVQNYNSNVRSFFIAIYQSDDLFNFASGNGGLFLRNHIDQGDFYMIFDKNYETFTTNIENFHYSTNSAFIPFGDSFNRLFIFSNLTQIQYTSPTWYEVPIAINNHEYNFNDYIPLNNFNSNYSSINVVPVISSEPTYSYNSTILDNGNVKLDFTFTNYTSDSGYAFEIENNTSNEEYGITNTYSSIFPNQIPFGTSYSIELSYDSLLYVTLAKYEPVEQTSLYFREEIYTNMIDINNVVFENEQEPYFVIYTKNKNNITGTFVNTTNKMTCWYRYSTSQNEDYLPCDEEVGFNVHDNGYVEVLIKKGTTTIYSRKINYLGANNNEPYIIYNITKQDFYSVVNWYIENEYSNMTYRYSIDNGQNFTSWINYNNNKNTINVFDNSTIIIEIANNNQSTIYDSKSIVVVNNISEIKNINNTTINFLDKFKNIFSVNTNILRNINNFYDNIKSSKIYLLIFIPFLASLIGAIIYLIRRK